MLKRLWLILGPVFCALLMVVTLLALYPVNHKHIPKKKKLPSVSMLKDSRVVQRSKKHFRIHSIALFLISDQVNGCVLMWCIQQFWPKNMTVITDPTF